MKARIFSRTGKFSGNDKEFTEELTIGSGRENRFQLVAKEIRLRHARIFFEESSSCYLLEVEGSSLTHLDGVEVVGRVRLDRLHVITLGRRHDLIFQECSETPVSEVPTGSIQSAGTIVAAGRRLAPPRV